VCLPMISGTRWVIQICVIKPVCFFISRPRWGWNGCWKGPKSGSLPTNRRSKSLSSNPSSSVLLKLKFSHVSIYLMLVITILLFKFPQEYGIYTIIYESIPIKVRFLVSGGQWFKSVVHAIFLIVKLFLSGLFNSGFHSLDKFMEDFFF
jgi:hypothetical protein